MNTAASVPVPLWRQLQGVATVLIAIRAGQTSASGLKGIEPGLRPGVQALLFHVLRWLGQAEALRRKLAQRAPPPAADALLCAALALAWRDEGAPYEPFTLVDQAVEAAKRTPAVRGQASFVNACLRRFLRERDALVAATADEPVALWNHPRWWIDRLRRDHPAHWQVILRANNRQAPMTLRVNRLQGSVAAMRSRLQAAGIDADPVGDDGLVLAAARNVGDIPGFAEGAVSVQDAAAQLAAPLLLRGLAARSDGQPLRVLDACAAPGGKTAHLLEQAGVAPPIKLIALDIDPERCTRIADNLARLGLAGRAQLLAADAQAPGAWWRQHTGGQLFDAILLDAPCTASGIVRRHPDVRWLRRESDVAQLAIVQAGLLATLWPMLRSGGRLLYCTCSVFRAEGSGQIQTFLAHNSDAVLRPSPGHLLPQGAVPDGALPDNLPGDHDGFFYALLEKRST